MADDLRPLSIADPATALEADFIPAAGMVCSSLRHAGVELLGLTERLPVYVGRGKTMGIPLLHPWANRIGDWHYEALGKDVDVAAARPVIPTDPNGLPMHGVLPAAWRVEAHAEDRVAGVLDHDARAAGFAAFPYPHRVEVAATLRDGALRIETTLAAAGEEPVPVCFGFHPYFAFPDVRREEWSVEIPVLRRLVLDDRMIPAGATETVEPVVGPLGELAFDDGYDELEQPAVFAVEAGGRRVELAFESGYEYAQVYAPPDRQVISFEPMTAPADALRSGRFPVAAPGEPYRAAFSIRVR